MKLRWVQYPNLADATGYGTVTGLCGANCRHTFFPFFEGFSTPAQTQYDLEENERVYQQMQQQRALERDVRKEKRRVLAADASGDPDGKRTAQLKLKEKESKLKAYAAKTGQGYQSNRVQVKGFNRSQASQAVWTQKKTSEYSTAVGVKTSTGITVTGVSQHFRARAVERGISQTAVREALTNPLKVGKIRTDMTQQFTGEKATTVINVDTGKAVTVWPTKSKLAKKLKEGGSKVRNINAYFSAEEVGELKKIGIVFLDENDYSDDDLIEIHNQITEDFPYEYDDNGNPKRLGHIFENIIDIFADKFNI